MPGITSWDEASQYLSTFTMVSGPVEVDFGGLPPLGSQVSYQLEGQSLTFSVGIDNGLIYDIAVVDRGTDLAYQLDQLLTAYGQPGEIYLFVIPATPDGPFFELFIHYPQQGILAIYSGSAVGLAEFGSGGEIVPTGFRICPIGIGPTLWLRPPGTVLVVPGNPIFGSGYSIVFRPLPSVTDMSLEDFYLTFKEADSSTCFETPVEKWP
jgi:hypothetical protein